MNGAGTRPILAVKQQNDLTRATGSRSSVMIGMSSAAGMPVLMPACPVKSAISFSTSSGNAS